MWQTPKISGYGFVEIGKQFLSPLVKLFLGTSKAMKGAYYISKFWLSGVECDWIELPRGPVIIWCASNSCFLYVSVKLQTISSFIPLPIKLLLTFSAISISTFFPLFVFRQAYEDIYQTSFSHLLVHWSKFKPVTRGEAPSILEYSFRAARGAIHVKQIRILLLLNPIFLHCLQMTHSLHSIRLSLTCVQREHRNCVLLCPARLPHW